MGLPTHGALSNFNSFTGAITYTSVAGYAGGDTFTFRVHDGDDVSSTATVSITVDASNQPPTATSATHNFDEDHSLDLTLLAHDADPGQTATLTFSIVQTPQHGEISKFNAATGKVLYTPNSNYNGDDSFTFCVTDEDGNESEVATVTIEIESVNDAPDVQNDRYFTPQNVPHVGLSLLDNDCDAFLGAPEEGNGIERIEIVSPPSKGNLLIDMTTGKGIYSPSPGHVGDDEFLYRTVDNRGTTSRVAKVTVKTFPVDLDPGDIRQTETDHLAVTVAGMPTGRP